MYLLRIGTGVRNEWRLKPLCQNIARPATKFWKEELPMDLRILIVAILLGSIFYLATYIVANPGR